MATHVKRLTEGGITSTLVRFAFPFLGATFLQALYGTADMLIIGWFCNSEAIAAVSTATQIAQIALSLVSGLTMGGTILIAQYVGAKRDDEAVDTIGNMFSLFGIASLIMTAAMFLLADPILRLMQVPEDAFRYALDYVLIASGGTIFVVFYNAISAMLRGLGDSKHPLVFVAVACTCNIILDFVLVGLGMGPGGAALATIISQGLSLVLAVIYLKRNEFIFDFKFKSLRLNRRRITQLIKLGLPVSLQDTTIHISFMIISAIVNSMGVVAAAAVGVCGRFNGFSMLPPGAFSGALSAIAAQNIGAGQFDRAKKTLRQAMLISLVCSVVFFVWAQVAPETIMQLFQFDPEVTAAGAEYLRFFSIDFLLVAVFFCFNGFFNGCGCTRYTMLAGMLTTLVLRVPLALLFSSLMPDGLYGLGLSTPLATGLGIIPHIIMLRTSIWKKGQITH